MTRGTDLIAIERERQIQQEGWTAEHDDEHKAGDLASAGQSYALYAWWQLSELCIGPRVQALRTIMECFWPWSQESWKPSHDPIRNLVKAGALIAAEIDRIQRRRRRNELVTE